MAANVGLGWVLLILMVSAVVGRSDVPSFPDYKVGDEAVADVITPVPLIVIDPAETETRRQQAASRVPGLYRFDAEVSDEVERQLRLAFGKARTGFLDKLEASYKKRKVDDAQLPQPKFGRVIASFQRSNRNFPLSTNLFNLWATAASDELVIAEWVAKVRRVMRQYLRENTWPATIRTGPGQVGMLFAKPSLAVSLEEAERTAISVARSNLFGLGRIKTEFQESFPEEEQDVGRFLAGFLKINCFFDAALTQARRKTKTDDIFAADDYRIGQVIVRQGMVIDAKTKAALDELRLRTAVDVVAAAASQKQAESAVALTRLEQQAAQARLEVQRAQSRNQWLLRTLAGTVLVALIGVWVMARRRRRTNFLPVLAGRGDEPSAVVECPSCNEPVVVPLPDSTGTLEIPGGDGVVTKEYAAAEAENGPDSTWKERALKAEQRAEKTNTVLRAGLIPELARWMMSKLVRNLREDRQKMVENQEAAGDEVAELARRLAEVQAPLQDRLAAYEKRIRELETQLAAKGEENRELIKAKIEQARRRLEMERAKSQVALN